MAYVLDLFVTLPISAVIVIFFIWEPFRDEKKRTRWSPIDPRSSKTLILVVLLALNFFLLSTAFIRVLLLSMQYLWILSISLFLYAVFRWYYERGELNLFLQDLTLSLLLLIGVNIVCYIIGFESPSEIENYHRAFDTLFNLLENRFYFPLATSTRILSILSGTAFLMALFIPFRWKSRIAVLLVRIVGAIACMFVLVAAGARIPFLALLAAVLLGLLWDRIGRFGIYAGTAGAVLLPAFVIGFSSLHDRLQAAGELPAFVERVFTMLTISNRDIIWSGAFSGAFRNFPSAVFGNGVFGHITSGASGIYGYLFEVSWVNPLLMGSHNSYIQILLDGGLLALIGFLALVGAVLWKLPGIASDLTGSSAEPLEVIKMERNLSIPLVYLLMTASTEVSISYLAPEILYLLVAVLLLIILGPGKRTLMQKEEESSI